MTTSAIDAWESKKPDETREAEEMIRKGGFAQVDAYRYNPASIRVRVIDDRFRGLPMEQRDALVETHLARLPEHIQADIVTLMTFSPDEVAENSGKLRERLLNQEFEDPSLSRL